MRRLCYGILVLLALPCLAAEPAGYQELSNGPLVLTNRIDADLTFGEKFPPKMSGE